MRLDDFRSLVRRQADEVPVEFLDGVLDVTVSPRTLPHPTRFGIFTLGECVPLVTEDPGPEGVQSRVVLYYGSFAALARMDPAFDWQAETWETLTHELRHHMEWRARAPDLEALDQAAEQNFARQDGERFAPDFYRDGDSPAPGIHRIDQDFFLEQRHRHPPAVASLAWHGRRWQVPVPEAAFLPAFLSIEGVTDPPPGELVLVLRGPPRWRDLFRRRPAPVFQAVVVAVPVSGDSP